MIEKKIENDGWQINHERLGKKNLNDELFIPLKLSQKLLLPIINIIQNSHY